MMQQTLSIEQVASICGVSLDRVKRWIGKLRLKTCPSLENTAAVLRHDLIDFLVQHNMPIPESLIPFAAKKILFVLSKEVLDDVYMQFVMLFFEKLKTEANCIIDYVSFGAEAKMKIMVYKPAVIILDVTGQGEDSLSILQIIRKTEEFCSIKVIALLRRDVQASTEEQISTLGVEAVMPRSIELRTLIEKIHSF